MAGKKTFRNVEFVHASGAAAADVTKVIKLFEGGAAGKFSVYSRRKSGAGSGSLTVYGSFVETPASQDLISLGTLSFSDTIDDVVTNLNNEFAYLVIKASFSNTTAATIEVYVTSF